MKCAAHHDVETSLACGRCGTPICPRCLVETPVGARCSKCANVKRLPTYQVSTAQYAKAMAAGLVIAVALGIAWAWLRMTIEVPFFGLTVSLVLGAGAAFAISEVVSRVINRKRGTPLQVIAAACFVLCYVVSNVGISSHMLTFFLNFDLYDLVVLAVGVLITTSRLR
jgi:hypothetical protein